MDPLSLMGFAGASTGAHREALYVEDLYRTFVYDGTGAPQSLETGIDLKAGGLCWLKQLGPNVNSHAWFDSARGARYGISSNTTGSETLDTQSLTSLNNNGFSLGNSNATFDVNLEDQKYISWSFKQQAGFFDIVTWTGNGVWGREIPHNLGSPPGMIIVKNYGTSKDWNVYHRRIGVGSAIRLNLTNGQIGSGGHWANYEPTSTNFRVTGNTNVNGNNDLYVAYLFAHDDPKFGKNSNEPISHCGSYVGNGLVPGPIVNIGFEPQFLLVKRTNNQGPWSIFDAKLGQSHSGDNNTLFANSGSGPVENTRIRFTSTGFQVISSSSEVNQSFNTYIFLAIRRPHKTPDLGTEVFDPHLYTSDTAGVLSSTSVETDLLIQATPNNFQEDPHVWSRFGGNRYLTTNETNNRLESGEINSFSLASNTGFEFTNYRGVEDVINWNFRRAPGFFDIVASTGNVGATNADGKYIRPHNLGVAPELIIYKNRTGLGGYPWWVWSRYLSNNDGDYVRTMLKGFQGTPEEEVYSDTTLVPSPDENNFYLQPSPDERNQNTAAYEYYLFASLPGVSKIGTYIGNGESINIDCGFTNGARFVLIKSTGTANWIILDSTSGINTGVEPIYVPGIDGDAINGFDVLDPYAPGFTVSSNAPGVANTVGDTYLYLAIA